MQIAGRWKLRPNSPRGLRDHDVRRQTRIPDVNGPCVHGGPPTAAELCGVTRLAEYVDHFDALAIFS
jgi:hypothetical protein